MQMIYTDFKVDDLHGTTVADYLIAIEANLRILDNDRVVYEEPYFPVGELARSLHSWLERGRCGDDFVFESMSFEESGVVTIDCRPDGWVFGSALTPGVVSSAVPWAEVHRCVSTFLSELRSDIAAAGIEPGQVIGD